MSGPAGGWEMSGHGYGYGGQAPAYRRSEPANLADILERVLDKGIVIAGDIQVNLLDIELLTIKLRLVIASVDRAKEMGINWWENDPTLSTGHSDLVEENHRLRERITALEERTEELPPVPEHHRRRPLPPEEEDERRERRPPPRRRMEPPEEDRRG